MTCETQNIYSCTSCFLDFATDLIWFVIWNRRVKYFLTLMKFRRLPAPSGAGIDSSVRDWPAAAISEVTKCNSSPRHVADRHVASILVRSTHTGTSMKSEARSQSLSWYARTKRRASTIALCPIAPRLRATQRQAVGMCQIVIVRLLSQFDSKVSRQVHSNLYRGSRKGFSSNKAAYLNIFVSTSCGQFRSLVRLRSAQRPDQHAATLGGQRAPGASTDRGQPAPV
jgi:hypothetical protein